MKLLKTNAFIDKVYSCSFVSIVAKKIRKLDSGIKRSHALPESVVNTTESFC